MSDEIRYEVTIDDLIALQLHWLDHLSDVRRTRRKTAVLFCILGALLAAIAYLLYLSDGLTVAVVGFAAFALMMPVTAVALPGLMRRQVIQFTRKNLDSDPGTIGSHVLRASDTQLIEETATTEGRWVWANVLEIAETPDYVFIYVGKALAHVLRRAQFEPGQLEAFLATVRNYRNAALGLVNAPSSAPTE